MLRFELDKWSIAYLYDLQKKGRLNLQPEWQRSKVWNDRMKYDLIDTALKDWPMGLVMINVVDRVDAAGLEIEHYEVVDGQQRISTLFDYRDRSADWAKKAPRHSSDFVTYADLESVRQEHFDEYKVAVSLMREYEQDEILDVYSRLQNSKPLQLGEKVKALKTELKPILADLATHKIFGVGGGRLKVRDANWNLAAQFFKSVYRGSPLDRQEFENLQAFYRRGAFNMEKAKRAQKQTSTLLNFSNKVIVESIQLDRSFEKTFQSPRPLKWLFASVYILQEVYALSGKEHLLAKGLLEYHRARDSEGTDEWTAYVNTGRTGRVNTDDV